MDLSCLWYDSTIIPSHPMTFLLIIESYPSSPIHWLITHTLSHVVDLPWCNCFYKYNTASRISLKLVLLCNSHCTFVFSSLVQFTKSQTCDFTYLDSVTVLCLNTLIFHLTP